jgi:hypothetical protein
LRKDQPLSTVWSSLLSSCGIPDSDRSDSVTVSLPAWKQRVTLCKAVEGVMSALDLAKVADLIMFVLPPEGVDDFGQLIISTIKSQGLPSVIGLLPVRTHCNFA